MVDATVRSNVAVVLDAPVVIIANALPKRSVVKNASVVLSALAVLDVPVVIIANALLKRNAVEVASVKAYFFYNSCYYFFLV